ncbi:phage head-tail joining protein [Camelimonas sp. ID_303_24]
MATWTQSDIDNLKKAIAEGVLEVRFADGRHVRYRSLKDMRETLEMMDDEVNPSAAPRQMATFAVHYRD